MKNTPYLLKKINKGFLVYMLVLNLIFLSLRFVVGTGEDGFTGSIFTALLFILVLCTLIYFLIRKNIDYFLMTWIATFYALSYVKIPIQGLGYGYRYIDILLMGAILFFAMKNKNKYKYILLTFIAYCLIDISSAPLANILHKFLKFTIPLMLFYLAAKRSKNQKLILEFTVLMALITLPIAAYEIFFQPVWGIFLDWRGFRIFGNLLWPNYYSIYLIPATLILYAKIRTRFNIYGLIGFILLATANIFTFSRSGILSIIVALFVFEFTYKGLISSTIKKLLFVLIIVLFVFVIFRMPSIPDARFNQDALAERTNIWDTITPDIQDWVFGNGLGSYELSRTDVSSWIVASHNHYLEIIFELGFFGLIILMIYMVSIIIDGVTKIRYSQTKDIYGPLLLALIISILFYSFFGNAAFTQEQASHWWIVMGCLLSIKEENNETK